MSLWEEYIPINEELEAKQETTKQSPSNYPNIYLNKKGKYVVYSNHLKSKQYIGTLDTLEEAYEAQLVFKQTGERAIKKKTKPLNEELKSLISEHHEQHLTTPSNPKEQISPFHT